MTHPPVPVEEPDEVDVLPLPLDEAEPPVVFDPVEEAEPLLPFVELVEPVAPVEDAVDEVVPDELPPALLELQPSSDAPATQATKTARTRSFTARSRKRSR